MCGWLPSRRARRLAAESSRAADGAATAIATECRHPARE